MTNIAENTYKQISCIPNYKNRSHLVSLYTANELKSNAEIYPATAELVGGKSQVRPYFDVDIKQKKSLVFDNQDLFSIVRKVGDLFPKNKIYIAKREVRDLGNGMVKHSYRFYVDGVRISNFNIKKLLEDKGYKNNEPFDLSVYDKNRILFLPYSTQKTNDETVPALLPIDNDLHNVEADALKCCASYIEEEFEDYDVKFNVVPKDDITIIEKFCDDVAVVYDGTLNFTEIMTKLSKTRANDYSTWIYICITLINLYHRKIITRGQIYDLFDVFSSKADSYDPSGVEKAIDTNI